MVAIIANNRVEWAAAAYACNGLGAVIVPMYEAQNEKVGANPSKLSLLSKLFFSQTNCFSCPLLA